MRQPSLAQVPLAFSISVVVSAKSFRVNTIQLLPQSWCAVVNYGDVVSGSSVFAAMTSEVK